MPINASNSADARIGLIRHAAKRSDGTSSAMPAQRRQQDQRHRQVADLVPSAGTAPTATAREGLSKLDAVHLGHVQVQNRQVKGLRPARTQASASAGEPVARGSIPQPCVCRVRMRRLVALSSTISTRLAAQLRRLAVPPEPRLHLRRRAPRRPGS